MGKIQKGVNKKCSENSEHFDLFDIIKSFNVIN